MRHQARHRRLAGAWRAPEDQGAKRTSVEETRECAVATDEMRLPRHLIEPRRAQAIGERPGYIVVETGMREEIAHVRSRPISPRLPTL